MSATCPPRSVNSEGPVGAASKSGRFAWQKRLTSFVVSYCRVSVFSSAFLLCVRRVIATHDGLNAIAWFQKQEGDSRVATRWPPAQARAQTEDAWACTELVCACTALAWACTELAWACTALARALSAAAGLTLSTPWGDSAQPWALFLDAWPRKLDA